jgi:flavin-dependent dehydrogenase
MTTTPHYDVIIFGGGLAGLTLALQLHKQEVALSILVLERKAHPVPLAAHKVGESSVEIGANYFDTVIGIQKHLTEHQLKKFGFRFFFSEGRRDIEDVLELGASRYLATPSYQLDRGVLENALGEFVRERGMTFLDAAIVRDFTLNEDGSAPHAVTYEYQGARHDVTATWVVDAAGRASLIKRKRDLAQANDHDANAVWFRIAERIDMDDWSTDHEWLTRCDPPYRWLSTNHLCGRGYWAWLIPLSSGSHSVGIVCDAKIHPLETMNTYDKAMTWFEKFQPRLYDALVDKKHLLQDFLFFRHFSYGCKQVFSGQRWALTGEAGLFLDPFYSPGSDFIAISNTYICELIAKDRRGEDYAPYARVYEQLYFSFYESTLSLYQDQYPIFGDPEVMPIKVIWDYTFYWGVLCQIWFQRRLTDLASMGRLRDELAQAKALNFAMQDFMRAWSEVTTKDNPRVMLDQASLPWFAELNRGLRDELDEAQFRARIRAYVGLLAQLTREILARALAAHPTLDASKVHAALGDAPAVPAEQGLLFDRAA